MEATVNPQWIDDRVSLASVVEALQTLPQYALDTEFERVRTFWPKLALVQIALKDRIVLIDPLALDDLNAFGEALHNGAPWLMHSASEDVIALKPLSPRMPTQLFDTQIAAALCGLGTALSYQKLVKQELDVDLAKSETRSDWVRRPLSAEQIEYAADDVVHLQALADRLGEQLDRLGRTEWLWQDGARQIAQSWDMPYPDNPHHEYRTAFKLDVEAQVRLCALLRWREQVAREDDRPRTWVIDNAIAMDFANTPPTNGQEVFAKLKTCRAFPRQRAGEVIDLLANARTDAQFKPAPMPLDRDTDQRMKTLRESIDAHAIELGIDPSTLCTRRLLEARVREGQWPSDCTAWRVEQLEPLARALL
jgi:ribonuclease D